MVVFLQKSVVFLTFHGFIDGIAEGATGNRMREREGERHAAKGTRLGVEPGSPAAMTQPLYMGRPPPKKKVF